MKPTSYAHLLTSAAAAKAKEVDPDESEKMESDMPDENESGKKKGKKAKSKKASDEGDKDEEDEDKESDEGESDEEKEDKKDKKEQDEDDVGDKKGKKKGKKAASDFTSADAEVVRLEERLRCAKIFGSAAAAGQPDVAAEFAFHTDMSADSAIAIMKRLPAAKSESAPGRRTLDERMSSVRNVNMGHDVEETVEAAPSSFLTEKQLAAMSPDQRALAVVNAARAGRNEEPLKRLPS